MDILSLITALILGTIKISKGSKGIMRIVDACFPSAEERAIKEMIEELNKGGKSDV